MRRYLILLFICCLAVPACRSSETAAEYLNHGNESDFKGEYDEAIADYNKVLAAANPNDPNEKQTIFDAYYRRGYAWAHKNEPDKAIADFSQALTIDPTNALPYVFRGLAWYAKGEHDTAIADFNQALAIAPKFAIAYRFRGAAWQAKGEYDKALADLTRAAALPPESYFAYDELAIIYATCPDAKYRDGKRAVENASKAQQLSGGNDYALFSTLAAAYAECGDFAKAREAQVKAIELASEENKEKCRARLELYEQGKPYHDQPVKK